MINQSYLYKNRPDNLNFQEKRQDNRYSQMNFQNKQSKVFRKKQKKNRISGNSSQQNHFYVNKKMIQIDAPLNGQKTNKNAMSHRQLKQKEERRQLKKIQNMLKQINEQVKINYLSISASLKQSRKMFRCSQTYAVNNQEFLSQGIEVAKRRQNIINRETIPIIQYRNNRRKAIDYDCCSNGISRINRDSFDKDSQSLSKVLRIFHQNQHRLEQLLR